MKILCKPSRARLAAGGAAAETLDLLVRLRAPAPEAEALRPRVALVPVVDVSGSMAGAKLAAVRRALEQLVRHLVPGDHVGLVTFDSQVRTPLPLVEVTEARKGDLLRAISQLRAGSNTNLSGGVIQGVELLRAAALPDGVRARAIVLTDGLANEGPAVGYDAIHRLVDRLVGPDREDRVRNVALAPDRPVSLSAFGYGTDCDQALLGDLASVGNGSYAFIDSDDVVMSAFARELGGLTSTYASEVVLRVEPAHRAVLPMEQRLGDLLHQGELSAVTTLSVAPQAEPAAAAEIARVVVEYRDRDLRPARAAVSAHVDFVAHGADRADDPEVVRVRDERVLRGAQEEAEARARRGDLAGARAAVQQAMGRLGDTALLEFAREVLLPCYGDEREYRTRSGVRAGTLAALRYTHVVSTSAEVEQTFSGTRPTRAQRDMEASFRGQPDHKAGDDPDDDDNPHRTK